MTKPTGNPNGRPVGRKDSYERTRSPTHYHPLDGQGRPLNFSSALSYALAVLPDPTAPAAQKTKLAIAAMPFTNAKTVGKPVGKKEEQREAARYAGNGDGWEDLMSRPSKPRLVASSRDPANDERGRQDTSTPQGSSTP